MKPMVPPANERVTEHMFNIRTVYASVAVIAPGNAVGLVKDSYRDGHAAGFAEALEMLRNPTQEIMEAAIASLGSDDDRPTALVALELIHAAIRALATAPTDTDASDVEIYG